MDLFPELSTEEIIAELMSAEEELTTIKRQAIREERRLKKLTKAYKATNDVGLLCRWVVYPTVM